MSGASRSRVADTNPASAGFFCRCLLRRPAAGRRYVRARLRASIAARWISDAGNVLRKAGNADRFGVRDKKQFLLTRALARHSAHTVRSFLSKPLRHRRELFPLLPAQETSGVYLRLTDTSFKDLCRYCKALAGAGWRTEPHQYLEQTERPPRSEVDGSRVRTRYRCVTCQGGWQRESGSNGLGWFPI